MIRDSYLHRSPPKNGGRAPESSRRREISAAAAASLSAARRAKRAADESPWCRDVRAPCPDLPGASVVQNGLYRNSDNRGMPRLTIFRQAGSTKLQFAFATCEPNLLLRSERRGP